jgi:hypothetical protein
MEDKSMAENNQPLDENAAAKPNDSSSAWDDLDEGKGEADGSKGTPEPPEKELQRLRSGIGRRLTKFEEEVGSVKTTLSRLEQLLLERETPPAPAHEEEIDEDPDRILTLRDLQALETKREKQRGEMVQRYQADYIKTVKSLYTEDPDNHAAIEKELLTNVKDYPTWSHRKDAKADAIANYWKARAKIIQDKYSSPDPNVLGKDTNGTGVSSGSRNNQGPRRTVKVDEVAAKFAKAMDMDDNYVQDVLTRDE